MNKIELDLVQLKALYEADISLNKIADRLNIHLSTLRNRLKDLGWERAPRTRKIKLNPQKIQKLYRLGLNREDILKKLKITRKTLIVCEKENGIYTESPARLQAYEKGRKTLQEQRLLGIKPEPRHNWSRLDPYKDDIQSMLLKGISKRKIIEKYRVCYATLYNFIVLHGLEAPKLKKLDLKKDKIKEMFANGKSIEIIAKELKCSHKLLEQEVKKMGLSRPKNQIKFNCRLAKQEELIKKLYMSGISGKEIAKRINAHRISVYRVIKRLNLVKNDNWHDYQLNTEKLFQMKESGMSFRQIGEYFGVAPATVFYQLKKLNKQK